MFIRGRGILPLGPGIQQTSGTVLVNLPLEPAWTTDNPFADTVGFAIFFSFLSWESCFV
jgi:hypothetical protein